MFEPNPSAPRPRPRGVRGRWREANAKREQDEEEARELQKQAEDAKALRLKDEAEIKQKLESHDSEDESQGGARSGVWDVRELDIEEEDGGDEGWKKVFTELRRVRREGAGNGRDMVLVCGCVLFSMLVVIFMFWMEWL
jgi:hypothetical protein